MRLASLGPIVVCCWACSGAASDDPRDAAEHDGPSAPDASSGEADAAPSMGDDAPPLVAGTVLAGDQDQPRDLVVHDGHVYFTSYHPAATGGAISRVPVAGGAIEVLAPAQTYPADLVVDDDGLYWINAGDPTHPGCVMALAAGASTPVCLEERPSANGPTAIASDADHLYFAETQGGSVRVIAKAGGASTRLGGAQVRPRGVAVAGAQVVWLNDEPTTMFSTGGRVRTAPSAGGDATTLAEGQRHPERVATDGTDVVWTSNGSWGDRDGEVTIVPLAGGAPRVLATGLAFPTGVVLDGDQVYFATAGDGRVHRVPRAGGATTTIAAGTGSPHGVAVDATHVYVADEAAGTIARIPR